MSKAKLLLILKAGEVVVEEVEDPILWQKVLATIQGERQQIERGANIELKDEKFPPEDSIGMNNVVEKFAKKIGVTEEEIRGAFDPQENPPYITLNNKYWEAMKKNTPKRGSGAVGPAAVVGTILALWFAVTRINESVTQKTILKVLDVLGVSDNNPARSVKNTNWLIHRRGGIIKIDPSQISDAEEFVKKFCKKSWNDIKKS